MSLPKESLVRVKVMAARRRTSVSQLLTEVLEKIVAHEDAYARARERHRGWLETPVDLGMKRLIRVTRDELHER